MYKIVNHIAGPPVELRADGAHVSRKEGREHQSAPTRWQEVDHRLHITHSSLVRGQVWIENHCGESNQNPGPRAQAVVGNLEQQGRFYRIFFSRCTHHPLCDVATTSRFCAGIPTGPPLHADVG